MSEPRDDVIVLGYVPAGTIVTQELINELMRGHGARQPYDLELRAADTTYQRLDFGPELS